MRKQYLVNLVLVGIALGVAIPTVLAQDKITDSQRMIESNQQILGLPKSAMKMEEESYLRLYDKDEQLIREYSGDRLKELASNTSIHKESKESASGEPYAEFYNENGLLLDPAEDIEKEMKDLEGSGSHKLFVFRQTTFINTVDVGQGKIFEKPRSLIIEPTEQLSTMAINLIDSTGQRIGTMELSNFTGSLEIPLESYIKNESYSIQFSNKNQNHSIDLAGGIVVHD